MALEPQGRAKRLALTPMTCPSMTCPSARPTLGAKRLLAELQFGEYFGNEACTDTFYTRTVLVVSLPPAAERGAIKGARLTADRVRLEEPPAKTPAASAKKPAAASASGGKAGASASASSCAAPLKQATLGFGGATPAAAASSGTAAGKKRAAADAGIDKARATAKAEDADGSDDDDDEEEYEVEAILKSRPSGKSTEYYVKCEQVARRCCAVGRAMFTACTVNRWKGYDDPDDNTWEPRKNLHADLIAEFEGQPAAKKHKGEADAAATAGKGKGKAKAVDDDYDEDEDDDEDDDEEYVEAAPSAASASRSSSAPPSLFPAAPAAKNAAGPRTIHVTGGRGNSRCQQMGGVTTVTLAAGQGLRELKTAIRKIFGKVDCHKLGSLTLASTGAIAKKNDLKDGCTVVCHYTYAPGDPSAFGGRRRGGFGGFRRGGGSDRERMLLMLMARGYGMF